MIHRGIVGFSLLLLLLTGLVIVQADEATTPLPGTPADNECNVGGVLYREQNQDGCPTEWYWKAGWYLARFNRGIISRENFPTEFKSVLPPPVKPAADGNIPAAGVCWPKDGQASSIKYLGPPNTRANLIIYSSSDCSGNTGITSDATVIIFTDSLVSAVSICSTFGTPVLTRQLNEYGYSTAPPNAYACMAA